MRHSGSVALSGRGFSLLEVLLVAAIIGLVAALTLPAFRDMASSSLLRDFSQRVSALLEFARVHATTTQNPTAVRFYQEASGEFEIVEILEFATVNGSSVTNRVSRALALPDSLVISSSLSTLLQPSQGLREGTAGPGPFDGRPYREFLIFPDGSTSLTQRAHPHPNLCLGLRRDLESADGPVHPIGIVLDPLTSRISTFER